MSRIDWILVGIILLGVFLFLYGANYYNEVAGWAGFALFVSGIAALIILYIYHWIIKQNNVQKP